MKKLIASLIDQIEKADFKDENGMSLKNNKAYADLKDEVGKSEPSENLYLLISSSFGYRRQDWFKSNESIESIIEGVEKGQEENEFMVFTTIKGNKIAVRASSIESITEPIPE